MVLPTLLDRLHQRQGSVALIQIGAFTGATENDPLFAFLKGKCCDDVFDGSYRAVLVEPVNRYFRKLVLNYYDCSKAIRLENVAIAEKEGLHKFFVLREDAEQKKQRMPPWTSQLSSLLHNRITELWDYYEKAPEIRDFLVKNTVEEWVLAITYPQLLLKSGLSRVDLLQIDAEGYDYEIIKTIDFENRAPAVLNYESVLLKDTEQECRDYLHSKGYATMRHGQDTLAIRHEYQDLIAGMY